MVMGVSALVMSFGMPAIGGVNPAAATLFALFLLFTLGKAFRHMRRCGIVLHHEWMICAFSMGLVVATICIFRDRVLYRFCAAPHRGGGLDSADSTTDDKSPTDQRRQQCVRKFL